MKSLFRSILVRTVVLATALLLPVQSASAANYSEDWTVTSWRVARIKSKAIIGDGLYDRNGNLINYLPNYLQESSSSEVFCLGPASWRVTGNMDGQAYTEDWTATDWLDTTDGKGIPALAYSLPDDGITASYETQATCDNASGFAATPIFHYDKCVLFRGACLVTSAWQHNVTVRGEPYMVVPTGMYGGLVTYFGYYSLTAKRGTILYKMGLRSIPTKWIVNGSL